MGAGGLLRLVVVVVVLIIRLNIHVAIVRRAAQARMGAPDLSNFSIPAFNAGELSLQKLKYVLINDESDDDYACSVRRRTEQPG
jgi:hypothetical protein